MGQPPTIYKPGKLNHVINYFSKTLKDFAAVLSPYLPSGGGTVDANDNYIVADNSNNLISIPSGGTHLIDNFSGMLLVNDHNDGGVELWICGGGDDPVLVARTPFGPGAGTMNISNNGYEWSNDNDQVGPFTFTVIKTRNGS